MGRVVLVVVYGVFLSSGVFDGFSWKRLSAFASDENAPQQQDNRNKIPNPMTSPAAGNTLRSSPMNISMILVTDSSLSFNWTMPAHENVSDLINFIVYFHERKEKNRTLHDWVHVPSNQTRIKLKNLEPGTYYSFYILANYTTGHQPSTYTFSYKTYGYGPDRKCGCDPIGTNLTAFSGPYKCNRVNGRCPCRNKLTTGLKCDSCLRTAYKVPTLGCEPCHCEKSARSDGTCFIDKDGLVLCKCLGNYGGAKCGTCKDGYSQKPSDTTVCIACECHNNTAPNSTNICDHRTGKCLNCGYNTTGDRCEECLSGYVGEATTARNCTLLQDTVEYKRSHQVSLTAHTSVIIGICGFLFLFIFVIVMVILWKRFCRRKPSLQFWTVELKDDHEQVSFTGMLEHPEYQNMDASLLVGDAQYDDQSAIPHSSENEKPPRGRHKNTNQYHTLDDRYIDA